MTVGSGIRIKRSSETELLYDSRRSQVDKVCYYLLDIGIGDLAGSERIDHYGYRLCHSDGICKLDLALTGNTGGNDVLGYISGSICSRAVYLRRILSREGSAAVTAESAVCINDDLSSGKAGISLGTADDKTSRRIHKYLRVLIDKLRRDYRCDNILLYKVCKFPLRNICLVLCGDDDRVDPDSLRVEVFDGYLALSVRTEEGIRISLTNLGKPSGELMCK